MCYTPAMPVRLLLVSIGFAVALSMAQAADKPPLSEYLDRFTLPPDERRAFDAAIAKGFDPSCRCVVFFNTHSGKVDEVSPEMFKSDGDRQLILLMIQRGILLPFGPGQRN
jgi:hypothetical protein